MRIESINHMKQNGVKFDEHIYVNSYNFGRDTNGNTIAHFSAVIKRNNAGTIELCASGRKRGQVVYTGGRHAHAEYELAKLGYATQFLYMTDDGLAKYKILNLGVIKSFDFSSWLLLERDENAKAYIEVYGCSRNKINVSYADSIVFYVVAVHKESGIAVNIAVDYEKLEDAMKFAMQLSNVFDVPWYVSEKLK